MRPLVQVRSHDLRVNVNVLGLSVTLFMVLLFPPTATSASVVTSPGGGKGSGQIVFPDRSEEREELPFSDVGGQKVKVADKFYNNPEQEGKIASLEENNDYYYEDLFYGSLKGDPEKRRRQEGCLCISHWRDPHCGSDNQVYDNGCFFLCAQKKNPKLYLTKWGPCS